MLIVLLLVVTVVAVLVLISKSDGRDLQALCNISGRRKLAISTKDGRCLGEGDRHSPTRRRVDESVISSKFGLPPKQTKSRYWDRSCTGPKEEFKVQRTYRSIPNEKTSDFLLPPSPKNISGAMYLGVPAQIGLDEVDALPMLLPV